MRDYQKNKLYRFEDQYINPLAKADVLDVEAAQDWVDFVWANEGRQNPPSVEHNAKFKRKAADATRYKIRISDPKIKRWILIHEITHSLMVEFDDEGDELDTHSFHGPEFVNLYLRLLDKYMNIPLICLTTKAIEFGVDWMKR